MTCPYASICLASRLPTDNICATCTIRDALERRDEAASNSLGIDFVKIKTTICYNCTDYCHCRATRIGQCDRTKASERRDGIAGAPISAKPSRCKKSDADWTAGKTCEPCDGCEVTP